MSGPVAGHDFLLWVREANAAALPVAIEGLKLSKFSLVQDGVDVTTGEDGCWRQLLSGAGLRSIEAEFCGVYFGSAAEAALRSCAFRGEPVDCEIAFGAQFRVTGPFLVTRYMMSGNVDDEVSYALTLQSAGTVIVR